MTSPALDRTSELTINYKKNTYQTSIDSSAYLCHSKIEDALTHQKAKFTWSDESVSEVKRLYIEENKSGLEIATILGQGLTRNAVMGKLNRVGCKKGDLLPTASKARKTKKTSSPKPPLIKQTKHNTPQEPTKEHLERAAPKNSFFGIIAAIESTKKGKCKAPISDPMSPDFHYCNKTTNGGTYCEFHTSLFTRPSPQRRK